MKPALARAAYSLLLCLLTPSYLLRLWWRGRREPAYRSSLPQRLGLGHGGQGQGRLWVHAVSLGETRAAASLIETLRRARPELRLLLTHSTATGREAGAELLREGDLQAWLPFDTPGAVKRFLRAHQPCIGVLMETEIWPNLLHAARRQGLPMVLANARLNERSLSMGLRMAPLIAPALAHLARVLAQTSADAWRLRRAGAADVRVCGNIKFDMTPPAKLLARGLQWRQALPRAVVLASSTREGEEAPLLKLWAQQPRPRPLLLLVPRHPQRFDAVAELVRAAGFSLKRRSQWAELPPDDAGQADVWLGDSMGEMPLYYAAADVALLGGSFEPLGGQNLIEAAACGCPLVMGPHTFNFELAAKLAEEAGAALRVHNLAQAVQRGVALATDPKRNDAVQHALDFAGAHRGASARMADEILTVLGSVGGSAAQQATQRGHASSVGQH